MQPPGRLRLLLPAVLPLFPGSRYLVWRHGVHHSAKVAGEIVGSWQTPVDMHLVTSDETELLGFNEGDWVLRLPDDLKPGEYRCALRYRSSADAPAARFCSPALAK